MPRTQRSIGWMYGQVVNRHDLAGATLFETVHKDPIVEPTHEHPYPYIAVLLRGSYREVYRHKEAQLVPFTAVFHPANVQHRCALNESGCQFFTLELETSWLNSMDVDLQAKSLFDWHGENILWQMLQLFREFRSAELPFNLTIESLILEILSKLGGRRRIGPRLPFHRWKLLEQKVHECFRESIRTHDLASAAGIHPVHAARLFRLKTGLSPGEYVQHLRAQCACRLMQDPDRSLGEIAAESGFTDQSHMNRILRRLLHCSPGLLRADLRRVETDRCDS